MGNIGSPGRDFRLEQPVDDRVFQLFAGLYAYDRTQPHGGRVDSVDDEHPEWTTEHVSYASAYGERVPALLFLPRNVRPPYQTVVWFPGAGAFLTRTPIGTGVGQHEFFQFLIRSGRAVLFPVYRGSYQRSTGSISQSDVWRDLVISATKDLRRGLDYLETRSDIDPTKFAFFGLSLGANVGVIATALEQRFKASVLLSGGLYSYHRPPESDALNFLPHVSVPTLMVNGRHDFFFPPDRSQEPMFALMGTSPEHKERRLFDSGHVPTERREVIRHVLEWLDRYLGRVTR